MLLAETAATPKSSLAEELGLGLATCFHALPSQCSMSVWNGPSAEAAVLPTTQVLHRDNTATLRNLDTAPGFGGWMPVQLAFNGPRTLGIALRATGLADGGGRGIELLREAERVLDGSGARLEHARAMADLGAALRRAGQRAESREILRRALDLAHRCGAFALTERTRTELVAAGGRPRRLVLSGLDSLTSSERRAAQLAAAGLSNREIAQNLFVTARTVEGHLTHAYQKLAITFREQLPAALAPPDSGPRTQRTGGISTSRPRPRWKRR
jgi:DNA-binding CsgD family transcriptional regulator